MHDMTEQEESQRDGSIPVVNTFMLLVPVKCVDIGMVLRDQYNMLLMKYWKQINVVGQVYCICSSPHIMNYVLQRVHQFERDDILSLHWM